MKDFLDPTKIWSHIWSHVLAPHTINLKEFRKLILKHEWFLIIFIQDNWNSFSLRFLIRGFKGFIAWILFYWLFYFILFWKFELIVLKIIHYWIHMHNKVLETAHCSKLATQHRHRHCYRWVFKFKFCQAVLQSKNWFWRADH